MHFHILLFVAGFFCFCFCLYPAVPQSISVQIWGALKLLFPPVIVLDKSSSFESERRGCMREGIISRESKCRLSSSHSWWHICRQTLRYQKLNPAVHCRAQLSLKNTRLLCIFGHFECFLFLGCLKRML